MIILIAGKRFLRLGRTSEFKFRLLVGSKKPICYIAEILACFLLLLKEPQGVLLTAPNDIPDR